MRESEGQIGNSGLFVRVDRPSIGRRVLDFYPFLQFGPQLFLEPFIQLAIRCLVEVYQSIFKVLGLYVRGCSRPNFLRDFVCGTGISRNQFKTNTRSLELRQPDQRINGRDTFQVFRFQGRSASEGMIRGLNRSREDNHPCD
jgi:hypothetical protein